MYTFKPSTFKENAISNHRLFMRLRIERSLSVLKINGEYYEMQYPSQDEIELASEVYLGGHTYEVSSAEAADLTAAGYIVTVS